MVTLDWKFEQPVKLCGNELDYLSWTVQDDLSNLSLFRISATGWEGDEMSCH